VRHSYCPYLLVCAVRGAIHFRRKVVEHRLCMKHCKVEVYLLELKLYLHPKANYVVRSISRGSTVGMLHHSFMCDT